MQPEITLNISYSMGIPKIIHQIWLQGKDQIPKRFHPLQESWLKNHRNWKYMLWDDSSIKELLLSRFSWFLDTYCGYPHIHQKIDSGRYFILYEYGGFYADLDMKSIKSLDILLEQYGQASMIASEQPFTEFEGRILRLILGTSAILTNAIMGTSKHFYVWGTVLPSLIKSSNRFSFLKEMNITYSTGPAFLSLVMDRYLKSDKRIKLLPHYYFEPRFSYDRRPGYNENSFVEHFQEATWHSKSLKTIFHNYFILKNMFKGR